MWSKTSCTHPHTPRHSCPLVMTLRRLLKGLQVRHEKTTACGPHPVKPTCTCNTCHISNSDKSVIISDYSAIRLSHQSLLDRFDSFVEHSTARKENGENQQEAVPIKTAALEGYFDILQRYSSRNSPSTHKFNGCKNCEGDIKGGAMLTCNLAC